MRWLCILMLLTSSLWAQLPKAGGGSGGSGSGSGVTSVTSLPVTCTPPQQVYLTVGATGYYKCLSPNSWVSDVPGRFVRVANGAIAAHSLVKGVASGKVGPVASDVEAIVGVAENATAVNGDLVVVTELGLTTCLAEGTVTELHYLMAGTSDTTKCRDSGQTSIGLIPSSSRIIGKAVGADSGGVVSLNVIGPYRFGAGITRTITIEGMFQGSNTGWSANYYLLGNGVWYDATWPLNDGTHQAPRLIVPAGARLTANNPTVVSGTYTSGGTVQGSAGQTCTWTATQPTGGRPASGTVGLTGSNTIAGGTALAVVDAGLFYLTAPIAATLSKSPTDTATSCGGSIVIATVLSDTPAGPYKIISVTTTNPTLNIGLEVASADNTNPGSMGLQYACVPLGSARANPARTALDPIPLTTIPTNSAIYWASRQVTCTGTPTAPASLYLYFDPTAPSGGSLVNYKWHIKYPEAQ